MNPDFYQFLFPRLFEKRFLKIGQDDFRKNGDEVKMNHTII
jgi:hypothetical protein